MSDTPETKIEETTETELTSSTPSSEESTGQTDTQATETDAPETPEFDAAAFEADYGMPAGSLASATDQDSALDLIRQHADKVLSAGFSSGSTAPPAAVAVQGETGQKPDASGQKPSGNAEIDALRAELVEVKTKIQQQEEAHFNGMLQELDRRISKEIDKWESPKYGKGDSRNFNQLKAVRELNDLVRTHIAGYQATGQPAPVIESVLRQVRAFHDTNNKPMPAKQEKQTPLGTPGAARSKEGEQPRSIHHAFGQNF